jgi:2'-5' RNA ligase
VLWAGLTGELEALSELQLAVDDIVGRLGLPKEQRPFSPHLTLGRVRRETSESQLRKIGEIMADAATPSAEPWTANTVKLMRTELDPAGSRHYLVGAAAIGGG